MNEGTGEHLGDDGPLCASRHPGAEVTHVEHLAARPGDVLVGRSVTIDRPRQELYAFWRNFENLPLFMHNIRRVTVIDSTHSRWLVAAPAGKSVEWPSAITVDDPGQLIGWESEEGASVRNSGTVEFKDSPERRGTVVTVTLAYDPPAGAIGQMIAKLFHKEPKIQARRDLRRFKQLMETGEVATAAPPYAAPRA
ncbi:MAG TPA: SRPBCC family protein [Steroidobacteraceae bacterium]|nr:SRPBCC family protein [Steroidobacteraceae bacterium]